LSTLPPITDSREIAEETQASTLKLAELAHPVWRSARPYLLVP
jgi:hypothetical protein